MKIEVVKASSNNYLDIINIDTMEELVKFMEQTGEDVIISRDVYKTDDPEVKLHLVIYDDYVE